MTVCFFMFPPFTVITRLSTRCKSIPFDYAYFHCVCCTYLYSVSVDRETGLVAGPFQQQLENVLKRTPVFIMMLTPAPSGPDETAHVRTTL